MLALVLLLISLVFAGYTGVHLKQALDAEHELRSQMGDLSLATMHDTAASSSAVSLGETSLKEALDSVRRTARQDGVLFAVGILGIVFSVFLLRRPGTIAGS